MDNKLNKIEDKVKDLLAECHEHGLQYAMAIVNPDTGVAINTVEGDGGTIVVSLGAFASRLVKMSELTVDEVMEVISAATEAAIEVQEEKARKK